MGDETRQREFRDFYDGTDYFDRFEAHFGDVDSPFNRYARDYVFSIHTPAPGDRVVDLGCGWGNVSIALLRAGVDVVGVDYSVKSVRICREGARRAGFDPDRFVCADVSALPFRSDGFDAVFTAGLVEHLFPDVYEAFLHEAFRILRPGGRFVIGTPNPGHVLEWLKRHDVVLRRDPAHVDYKTMPRLRRTLEAAGFRIERAYYHPSHLPVLRVVERLAQRIVPPLRRRLCVLAVKPGGGSPRDG